ncbi:MAG: capsular biosynthesis protein [Clostridia bacterium]|nr:capsular biosynthesis protein [Clostridia bacterium]
MIDIHCHILPGADDGAGNMSDALEMAELAASSGIKRIIVTPHCNVPGSFRNYWNYFMAEDVRSLQNEIRKKKINLTVYPGQEVYLAPGFVELLKKGEFIGLNESKYMLVEFGMRETADVAYRKLQQVIAEGYVPIVAHPERYGFVSEQQEAVYRMKDLGALLQVNRGSIKGAFGMSAMKKANEIISTYQADFVASDAHSQYSRTPYLADVHEFISEEISADYGDWLFKVNPSKVINGEEIYSF